MRATLSLLLLIGLSSGCTAWVAQGGSLDQVIRPASTPRHIRLVLRDSTRLQLFGPTLTPDSVIGSPWSQSYSPTGTPRDRVQAVEVRQFSPGRTMLLIGGLFVGGRLILGPVVESSIMYGRVGIGLRVAP